MKKIFLAVLATLSLLTATGQQLQYRNDYVLPHYLATGCINFEKISYHVLGNANGGYAYGYAQPFVIDSAVSIKGIAAFMNILQPETSNQDYPLYLQIRDSTLTQVLAQIRYDTLNVKRTPDSNRAFIEELFNRSILIQDSKFYIVATFKEPYNSNSGEVSIEAIDYYRAPNCYDGNFPLLIWGGKNEEWLPANVYDSLQCVQTGGIYTENRRKLVPFEMFVFPILGTIDIDSTDTSGHNNIGQVELEKYTYLYPNPATHEITIVSSVGLTKVEVFNMAGIKVYEQEIKANRLTVDVSAFAKGTYAAKLHTRQGIVSKKFIIQ